MHKERCAAATRCTSQAAISSHLPEIQLISSETLLAWTNLLYGLSCLQHHWKHEKQSHLMSTSSELLFKFLREGMENFGNSMSFLQCSSYLSTWCAAIHLRPSDWCCSGMQHVGIADYLQIINSKLWFLPLPLSCCNRNLQLRSLIPAQLQ